MKTITGITSGTANGSVSYPHGVDDSFDILGVHLLVNNVVRLVPHGEHPTNPDKFYYHIDEADDEIIIQSEVTSTNGIGLSRPFTVLIIYKE